MTEKPTEHGFALKAAALLVAVLVAAAVVAYLQLPPAALPASAPPREFSAARAFVHIQATAQVPHPDGTPENRAVRDYLLKTLDEMGVAAEIHRGIRDWGKHRTYAGIGMVENVLARIPGTGGDKAFALMAHYDSVPYGPGAADDMSGVATMLEVARALKAGAPLRNDVIFVFTNGEEGGLHGAKAFAEHPWANEVGVLLNMEARGTRGPSYMFETSEGNGWLIAQLASSGVPVRASSMMYDVYEPLPFSTDFDPLKEDIPGFNIAFVDNFAYYHTPNDSTERLNLASLQHHGEYALGLARHFGNIPLENTEAPDATYFDLLGLKLIHYPLSWNPLLTVLAIGAWFAAGVIGLYKGRLTVKSRAWSGLAFLCAALAACLGAALMLGVAWLLRDGYPRILYDQNLYGAAIALAATALFLLVEFRAFRFEQPEDRYFGALFWWALLCLFLQAIYPGGAYLAQWPLLFASIGTAAAFLTARSEEQNRFRFALITAAFALPGIVLLVPNVMGFFSTLTLLFIPLLVLLFVFMLGLFLPVLDYLMQAGRWKVIGSMAAVSLVLFITALAINGPSRDRPDLSCLSYGLDLDTSTACWISSDPEPSAWTSPCFPGTPVRETIQEYIPWDTQAYMSAPAPAVALPGPEVKMLSDEETEDARVVTLFVHSPRQAPAAVLYSETSIISATILGIEVEGGKNGWWRTIHILPPEGAQVILRTPPHSPLKLRVIERSYGLPEVDGLPPCPETIIGEPNTTLDHKRQLRSGHVFVARTFAFPPAETAAAP